MGKNLITTLGLITALGLSGCNSCIQQDAKEVEEIRKMNIEQLEKGPEMVDYFSEIQIEDYTTPLNMVYGDFNEDGHLDLIVSTANKGTSFKNKYGSGKLYFYEGDGKGNFTKKLYEKK
ncbi:MAG: VCBS repeat-containing protein [Candidatus Pacearchaeota archaeon]|nr:VCBS repeat-containing protein [Candidatus Pacearchaeota archaeon]